MKKRKGFTLIELLVIIAIIGIMLLIILPIFGKARAKAQQANCLSSLKEMSLAQLMYSQNNGKRLPSSENWRAPLNPYTGNKIYQCFSAKDNENQGGYGMNSWLSGADLESVRPRRQTPLLADCHTATFSEAKGLSLRHSSRTVNVARADGSARIYNERTLCELRFKPKFTSPPNILEINDQINELRQQTEIQIKQLNELLDRLDRLKTINKPEMPIPAEQPKKIKTE